VHSQKPCPAENRRLSAVAARLRKTAGGTMTDGNTPTECLSQPWQRHRPQATTAAVTASTVGGAEKLWGPPLHRRPHVVPPAPQGLDRKGGWVVIAPHTDPAHMGRGIVHSVGTPLAQLLVHKILGAYQFWLPLGWPCTPPSGAISHQFLLLGGDRHYRRSPGLKLDEQVFCS
jgi:hypothetical protein